MRFGSSFTTQQRFRGLKTQRGLKVQVLKQIPLLSLCKLQKRHDIMRMPVTCSVK